MLLSRIHCPFKNVFSDRGLSQAEHYSGNTKVAFSNLAVVLLTLQKFKI